MRGLLRMNEQMEAVQRVVLAMLCGGGLVHCAFPVLMIYIDNRL